MPLGDIVGEVLGGVVRIVIRIFLELFVEILLQGTGSLIIRLIRPKATPSDLVCGLVGVAFWAIVIAVSFFAYRAFTA